MTISRSPSTSAIRRTVLAALAGCACAVAATHAAAPFTIDAASIAAGSHVMDGPCSRLYATLGEPAPGFSSGNNGLSLSAGFQAMFDRADNMFFDSFEGCRP